MKTQALVAGVLLLVTACADSATAPDPMDVDPAFAKVSTLAVSASIARGTSPCVDLVARWSRLGGGGEMRVDWTMTDQNGAEARGQVFGPLRTSGTAVTEVRWYPGDIDKTGGVYQVEADFFRVAKNGTETLIGHASHTTSFYAPCT